MTDCNKIWINNELYKYFSNISNPCRLDWIKNSQELSVGTIGKINKVSLNVNVANLQPHYVIKSQPLTENASRERNIMRLISDHMLAEKAPLLFPFLYLDYVCENTSYLLIPLAEKSLATVVKEHKADVKWWVELLYQLSKAIYYLEEQTINHNDLTLENIMFQYITPDFKEFVITVIDFGSAVKGHKSHNNLPPFVLGRDLNYFLYNLIVYNVIPGELGEKLKPFILWENYPKMSGEDQFIYGLRCTNLIHHNWRTSGKNLSRWLATQYPFVTDRCSLKKLDKLNGVGFGAVIGDALGMPVEFDHNNTFIVKKMFPSAKFNGLLASKNLPAGTFTDDTQMALALITAIMQNNRFVVPSMIAKEFKIWRDSAPIDIGIHVNKVISLFNQDGTNWESVSIKVNGQNPLSATNGAVMRAWPLAILHHYSNYHKLIDNTILQSKITHMNNDAIYAAVFVTLLIHKLVNGAELDGAIKDSINTIGKHVSYDLLQVLNNAHTKNYGELTGGTGWVVNTMEVVMWSIRNTTSFRDALIAAVNVRGDSDTNASITGAIAGAIYGFSGIPSEWVQPLDLPNKYNYWKGRQIDVNTLKDLIATLAQC